MPVATRLDTLPRTRSAPATSRFGDAGELTGREDRLLISPTQLLPSALPPTIRQPDDVSRGRLGIRSFLFNCDVSGEQGSDGKGMKEMRGSLLVVASLLASVTYQAGLSPPGGLWQDTTAEGSPRPHRAGDPVLQNTDGLRFQVFNIFNTISYAYAVGVMMHLITNSVLDGWNGGPRTRKLRSLIGLGNVRTMKYMMLMSLLFLSIAFAAGSCRNWWCSLGAVSAPLLYFMSCLVFEMLYAMFKLRRQRKLAPAPAPVRLDPAQHL